MTFVLLLVMAGGPAQPSLELLRQVAADTALAQVRAVDGRWHPDQRDCAGLVRFSIRQAYKRIAPKRLETPLFVSNTGPTDFADAEALLEFSFAGLGRDERKLSIKSGDVLAFRQVRESGDVFHLMLVVAPADRAHAETHVVYHPGEKDAPVRVGRLSDLMRDAPGEWRPAPENPSFLGFFRFKEWMT
jgi:uncharacterized protein